MIKFHYTSNADKSVPLPERKTAKSAGYDIYMPREVRIEPHSYSGIIPLDIKAEMVDCCALLIYVRSSIGIKKHLMLANGVGIIDADYFNNPDNEGNIGADFYNNSDEVVVLKKGERVCQGIFTPFYVTFDDNASRKRTGGYGSSGK